MSNLIKSLIYSSAVIVFSLSPFLVQAQLSDDFKPFDGTAGAGKGSNNLLVNIRNIVNSFLALAGIVAAIAIVISGVQYLTALGDEDAARTAKRNIIYAAIGIVVILLSGVFVNFVILSID